jgi:predicted dehydrogenase
MCPIPRSRLSSIQWPYIHEIEHFMGFIRGGVRPRATGEDGRWAMAAVLAGTTSLLEERPVYLAEVLEA